MCNYTIVFDNKDLEKIFMEQFVDKDKFDLFAKMHPDGNVHLFDFLKNSKVIKYKEIENILKAKSQNTFMIMWNLSQCYKNGKFIHDYHFAQINKKDLMQMLLDQKKDMEGEKLCYYKDEIRASYWDMIIFDKNMTWYLTITHEDDITGDRLCFRN